jgi:DNA-binding GntR family transcriptional regulator
MHVIKANEEILAACRAGNAEEAAARMSAHVGELEHLVKRRFRSALTEPTRIIVKASA